MKRITWVLMAAATMTLAGCSRPATRAGEQLAQEFLSAWGDTTALLQTERHYHMADDSLWIPNSSMYLKKAFLLGTALNDSTCAMAQAMAYDRDNYAELQAFRILEELKDENKGTEKAQLFLSLIDWATGVLGKPDYAAAAKEELDREVRQMRVPQQMSLYSRVATPTALGMALKADRESPEADLALIERQITELEKIYTTEQMQAFREAYGN